MALEQRKLINTCVWWEFDWDLALSCALFSVLYPLNSTYARSRSFGLGRPRFAEPLTNISLEIDISVSGAALGGLQRYVSIQGLIVKEGGRVPITSQNINFSAVTDFISMHHRGKLECFKKQSCRISRQQTCMLFVQYILSLSFDLPYFFICWIPTRHFWGQENKIRAVSLC